MNKTPLYLQILMPAIIVLGFGLFTARAQERSITFGILPVIQETGSVAGTITDEGGKPVTGATVFITNTTKMTVTNDKGAYRLTGLGSGTYELVVNMLGFAPSVQNITIQDSPLIIDIILKAKRILLDEVVINRKADPIRKLYLGAFTEYFIGKSSNAGKCSIVNPQVLNFTFDKQTQVLKASADELLIIRNDALGYKLNFLINEFFIDYRNGFFSYEGSPYFQEMPGSTAKQREWKRNRRVAYEGSLRHFFRSVYNNNVEAEGFFIYQVPDSIIENFRSMNAKNKNASKRPVTPALLKIGPTSTTSLFVPGASHELFKLNFDEQDAGAHGLFVVYSKEKEQNGFNRSAQYIPNTVLSQFPVKLTGRQNQISRILPLRNDIVINKNGMINPVKSFFERGYWTWERSADLVPLDYEITSR